MSFIRSEFFQKKILWKMKKKTRISIVKFALEEHRVEIDQCDAEREPIANREISVKRNSQLHRTFVPSDCCSI